MTLWFVCRLWFRGEWQKRIQEISVAAVVMESAYAVKPQKLRLSVLLRVLPSLHGATETRERSNSVEPVDFHLTARRFFSAFMHCAITVHEFLISSRERKVIGHSSIQRGSPSQ